MEQPTSLTTVDIDAAFGAGVDPNDQIEGIGSIDSEVYTWLCDLPPVSPSTS